MKRIQQLVVVAVVALAPFVLAFPASALGTCAIGYTGPDSNNQCTSQTTYTCTVNNDNNVDIVNNNEQTVASGNVTNSSNTQVGGTVSGQVTNTNGAVFNVSITNNDGARSCNAVATVPATETPVTPVTPVAVVTPVTAVTTVQPPASGGGATAATLPHTSGDSFSPVLAIVLAVLGVGAAASYLGATIYRRIKS